MLKQVTCIMKMGQGLTYILGLSSYPRKRKMGHGPMLGTYLRAFIRLPLDITSGHHFDRNYKANQQGP